MSSLADASDLVGFFSYSREDDEDSGGKLSKLRERIQAELRGQLGRTKRDFRLWQDKTAIAHGELWEDRIKSAVAESVFFIPIITPTAVRSSHCKFEFDSFLAREKELGRSNLVFPILYIPVPALEDERLWSRDPLLSIIGSRQYEQWQNLRHLDASSTEVALRVEKFCANICRALQQPWLSPEERREAEARRVAEAERRQQQEAEIKQRADQEERRSKAEAEKRRRDEDERRRQQAEDKRRFDEAEAEKRRQDKERRKLEKEEAWAAKKAQALHRWREVAAAAVVVALLLIGGFWLYRTTTPAGVTSAVVQPDTQKAENAKAQPKEAEQQRLAAVRAGFSITEATAVRGDEYRIIRQVNFEQCSNQCAEDNRCKMFAYWKSQICYLFNQNFGTYPTAGSMVGTKSN
jgi:hypothetical protein